MMRFWRLTLFHVKPENLPSTHPGKVGCLRNRSDTIAAGVPDTLEILIADVCVPLGKFLRKRFYKTGRIYVNVPKFNQDLKHLRKRTLFSIYRCGCCPFIHSHNLIILYLRNPDLSTGKCLPKYPTSRAKRCSILSRFGLFLMSGYLGRVQPLSIESALP